MMVSGVESISELTLDKMLSDSLMLYKMDHPYLIYKDISVSPWDICLTLLSDDVTNRSAESKKACPHCGGGY
jgi:hypothetical protein